MIEALKKKYNKESGFTLVELLIVVAIIAILIAISIPLITSNLDKAKTNTDAANVRAAKAVAVLEKIEGTYGAADTVKIYDAPAGKLVAMSATPEDYGQTTDHSGDVIFIKFNGDEVQYVWAPASATAPTTGWANA